MDCTFSYDFLAWESEDFKWHITQIIFVFDSCGLEFWFLTDYNFIKNRIIFYTSLSHKTFSTYLILKINSFTCLFEGTKQQGREIPLLMVYSPCVHRRAGPSQSQECNSGVPHKWQGPTDLSHHLPRPLAEVGTDSRGLTRTLFKQHRSCNSKRLPSFMFVIMTENVLPLEMLALPYKTTQ